MNEAQVNIDTFEQARQTTRRYAKTFYFASHALPPDKRRASYALYAFCRHVDNIADAADNSDEALKHLGGLRSVLGEIYGEDHALPGWRALQETVTRYAIPRKYFDDLIAGVEMDLVGFHCETFEDLHNYCYHVASVVGLMMTRILKPESEEVLPYAADLGTGMQLTNILRDIKEDHGMHRIYLPAQEMREWGVDETDLRDGVVTAAFRRFMQFQVARAREFYAKADPGIEMLPNDGSRYCVRAMRVLYSRILDAIEVNKYNVFTRRAHVSLPRKLGLAAAIAREGSASPYFLLTRGVTPL
jgi:15-cis-phytoene synthase